MVTVSVLPCPAHNFAKFHYNIAQTEIIIND